MARRRMIDPNFWGSEDVSRLSFFSRLLLIGMISNADDEGRGRANPAYLRAIVFPYDDIPASDITLALEDIIKWIHVKVYTVDGQTYYALTKWNDWQRVDSPKSSIIPPPPGGGDGGGGIQNSKNGSKNESGNGSKNGSKNDSKNDSENQSWNESYNQSGNGSSIQPQGQSGNDSINQSGNGSKIESKIVSGLKEVKRSKDNINKYFCAEQPDSAGSPRRSHGNFDSCDPPGRGPPIITLQLNDKTEFPVFAEQLREWAELYPAVDVAQQLRNMRGWFGGNPRRRKTRGGILRFITGWLANEQNNGGTRHAQGRAPPSNRGGYKQRDYDDSTFENLVSSDFGCQGTTGLP